jgi:hypothetical protein
MTRILALLLQADVIYMIVLKATCFAMMHLRSFANMKSVMGMTIATGAADINGTVQLSLATAVWVMFTGLKQRSDNALKATVTTKTERYAVRM